MAKKELKLKKEYAKGVTKKRCPGFGVVTFDPQEVDAKDYPTYKTRGFDIFEEGKSEPTEEELAEAKAKKEAKAKDAAEAKAKKEAKAKDAAEAKAKKEAK